jgi:uncharacterized protein (DUF3084 family)
MEGIMDLTPLINGALLAVFTVVLAWLAKGRFDALEKRIDGVGGDVRSVRSELQAVRSELQAVRSELKADIHELRVEIKADINALRSDLTIVALAVGAQPRPHAG